MELRAHWWEWGIWLLYPSLHTTCPHVLLWQCWIREFYTVYPHENITYMNCISERCSEPSTVLHTDGELWVMKGIEALAKFSSGIQRIQILTITTTNLNWEINSPRNKIILKRSNIRIILHGVDLTQKLIGVSQPFSFTVSQLGHFIPMIPNELRVSTIDGKLKAELLGRDSSVNFSCQHTTETWTQPAAADRNIRAWINKLVD